MDIKCGATTVPVDENDEVMFNGGCYQIVTKNIGTTCTRITPIISKITAKKLIREGVLLFDRKSFVDVSEVAIYKFNIR